MQCENCGAVSNQAGKNSIILISSHIHIQSAGDKYLCCIVIEPDESKRSEFILFKKKKRLGEKPGNSKLYEERFGGILIYISI